MGLDCQAGGERLKLCEVSGAEWKARGERWEGAVHRIGMGGKEGGDEEGEESG